MIAHSLWQDACSGQMPTRIETPEKRFLRALLILIATLVIALGAVAYVTVRQTGASADLLRAVMQARLASQPAVEHPERKSRRKAKMEKIQREKRLIKPDMPHGHAGTADTRVLPYLDSHPEDAGAYLHWILSRGGTLVLTRGFRPVGLLNDSFTVYPVPDGFRLPSQARNVSSELSSIVNPLPAGATMALLIWPLNLEKKLEREFLALPGLQKAARLRASYALKHGRLEIHIRQALVHGRWIPVRFKIVL